MAPISKRIAGAGVSGIAQKQCARCSAKVKKDAFCPHCRKFFQELSKPDPALATTVHGAKRHSPPSDYVQRPHRKAWISRPPADIPRQPNTRMSKPRARPDCPADHPCILCKNAGAQATKAYVHIDWKTIPTDIPITERHRSFNSWITSWNRKRMGAPLGARISWRRMGSRTVYRSSAITKPGAPTIRNVKR